ncbi:hypothetical protein BJ970_006922 [Saccharopolyspora phatthalungensis]|uniref:Uncharacterized protein n=2 Tax=Saccharopolyspora phatthalungensis TaxID=664693 RepID=A0A840QKT1_9PSEU|nr:hypothetical protein [Saccharopolyspora phatthalungensis]
MNEVAEDATAESARASTFRAICRNLVHSEPFSGPKFSWGDGEISTVFDDQAPKWGAVSRPVALATSHHVAYLATRTAT